MGATLFRNKQTEKLVDTTCTYNNTARKTYEWRNTVKCNPSTSSDEKRSSPKERQGVTQDRQEDKPR